MPKKTSVRLYVALLVVCVAGLGACRVESSSTDMGCANDTDCRFERLCVDRICMYPEDAEKQAPAELLARRVFNAAVRDSWEYFLPVIPTERDLDWGFNWRFVDPWHLTQRTRLEQLADRLEDDFDSLSNTPELMGATFTGFEPGAYTPIPEGTDLARRPLDGLSESVVFYKSADGTDGQLVIGQMVRLRGRWKLFRLID